MSKHPRWHMVGSRQATCNGDIGTWQGLGPPVTQSRHQAWRGQALARERAEPQSERACMAQQQPAQCLSEQHLKKATCFYFLLIFHIHRSYNDIHPPSFFFFCFFIMWCRDPQKYHENHIAML